ncbi:MAG: ABC transporter ATP-binding protein [bacterium]
MTTYLRILGYVRSYWLHLLASIFCIFLFTIFSSATLVSTIPLLKIIFTPEPEATIKTKLPEQQPQKRTTIFSDFDEIRLQAEAYLLTEGKKNALEKLCVVIVCLIFLKGFFGYLQSYFMAYVEQGSMMRIRNDLYRHINSLSLGYFHRTRTGAIISHITNDVSLINNGISAAFVTLVKNPLLIVAYLSFALYISWQLTIAALLILPFSATIIGFIGVRLRKESTASQEKIADVTSVLQETISGIRVVKAFAMEHFEIRKFFRESKAYFRTLLRITRVRNLASPVTEFLGALVGVGILWYGGQQILAGRLMGPEDFIGFLILIFSLMQPAKELSSVTTRLQEALAAGDRIFALLDTPVEIKDSPDAVAIDTFKKSIEFENVSFAYGKNETVLQNIDLSVRKGKILAIVGPSGAGKSTLVDLVPRFYDPQQGTISIDGYNLKKLTLASLRSLMGIVTQETILFNDTLRNNIAYGLGHTSDENVEKAARVANAHTFIAELPDGYETVIGERGVKLSGGQRQRIAIARAVLKNPPILILDEATSALDTESELLVQQAIERLMENRTTFVIAHRLSTILHADLIIVLDKGRIVQQGTHEELLNKRGIYQRLYKMQFRA